MDGNCCFGGPRIDHIHAASPVTKLLKSTKSYYEWHLLNIGNFTNIDTSMPGPASELRAVECCPGVPDGAAFQAFKKDWVWEGGVVYTDMAGGTHTPNTPNVYVGGVLQVPGSYSINYPDGMVVFPAAPSGAVTADYAFKNIQVYLANDVPWYRELQFRSWNIPENHFTQCAETGDWIVGGNRRMQMPTVIISPVGRGSFGPIGLGECGGWRFQDISFHIFTEDACVRNNLVDFFVLNDEKCVNIYDCDQVIIDSSGSLDCNGDIDSGLAYPDLCTNWGWSCARIEQSRVLNIEDWNCGFFEAEVHATFRISV